MSRFKCIRCHKRVCEMRGTVCGDCPVNVVPRHTEQTQEMRIWEVKSLDGNARSGKISGVSNSSV
jgi:hypothetical protein